MQKGAMIDGPPPEALRPGDGATCARTGPDPGGSGAEHRWMIWGQGCSDAGRAESESRRDLSSPGAEELLVRLLVGTRGPIA